jgi:hypothetical protein
VKVVLDTNALLNVFWKNTLILSNYQTSYLPSPGQLVFAGRTGGAWENHHVEISPLHHSGARAARGVSNSPATAVQTTSATLGGSILPLVGSLAGVTIFYGPSDGGTNAPCLG